MRISDWSSDVCSSDLRIAASDLGHYCIMPLVQRHSVNSAPNVTFTAVPIGRSKLISELEEGAADVAIGSYPSPYANVKEQTLFREDYVCILPKVIARSATRRVGKEWVSTLGIW